MAYSEEEILDELERISEEYSDPPTWKEIKANGNIGPETICNRLNKSWTEILSDMHFEHNRTKQKGLKTWSKEEFIEEVNKTIPEIEGTIHVSDVSENMESFTRYYERWSMTWREVLEECGVYQEKIPSVLWTEEEKKEWLDDKLEKHTQECDGFPYKKDFAKEYGKTHWICHYNWEGRFTNSNHSAFVEKCLEAQKREDCMSLFEC